MSDNIITCGFCQKKMIPLDPPESKRFHTYICVECGAYAHQLIRLTTPFIVELKEHETFLKLELKKPQFDELLKALRSHMHSEEYEYNIIIETMFYELQQKQEEE